jgi:hypothetical protein
MAQQDPNKLFGQGSAGSSAFKAAYDRLKSESQAKRQAIGQDYSGIYNQLRGQQYAQGLGAAAQRGLSGGQAAGMQNRVSAAQMGQLGNVLTQQQRALGEQTMSDASIYSNALLEGQQAQEYSERQQQSQFQRTVTANQILNKKGDFAGYSKDEQRRALIDLGYTPQQVDGFLGREETTQAQYNEAFRNLNPSI